MVELLLFYLSYFDSAVYFFVIRFLLCFKKSLLHVLGMEIPTESQINKKLFVSSHSSVMQLLLVMLIIKIINPSLLSLAVLLITVTSMPICLVLLHMKWCQYVIVSASLKM